MRVLYLAGLGRNGSTITSNVLGTVPGTFLVGEVRSIWSHGFVTGALCGCGVPIPTCAIWGEVAERMGGVDEARARTLARIHDRTVRNRNLGALLKGATPKELVGSLGDYVATLTAFYRAIQEVTGAEVIVDSSKSPVYAAVLRRIPDIDLRVVHQVRDARASVHAWTKERAHTDLEGAMMPQYPPLRTAMLWNTWNLGAERLRSGRYLRIRYEDFGSDPRTAIRQILDFAGLDGVDADWSGERSVRLAGHHMVHGNPSRGDTGSIEIRRDEAWTEALDRSTELLVSPLTMPLQLRYGYPQKRPRRGGPA